MIDFDSISGEEVRIGSCQRDIVQANACYEISFNSPDTEATVKDSLVMREYVLLQRGPESSCLRVSDKRYEEDDNRNTGVICYAEKLSHLDPSDPTSILRSLP